VDLEDKYMVENEKLVLKTLAKLGKEPRAIKLDGWVRFAWILNALTISAHPEYIYRILLSLESQGWIEFHEKREKRGKPYLCRVLKKSKKK
jgi:hypothetical protein